MNNHKQSVNWSDDSSSEDNDDVTVGNQPNRDFPPSDEEDDNNSEEEYDMDNIRQLTINNCKSNLWTDIFKPEDKVEKKPSNILTPKTSNLINNIKDLQIYEKRKFNPRLPPPDKYKKYNSSNGYKINKNEFPTLK
jgi:hypothetical protein